MLAYRMLAHLISLFLYCSPEGREHFRQLSTSNNGWVFQFLHILSYTIYYLFIFSQYDSINLCLIVYICSNSHFSIFPVGMAIFSILVPLVNVMCCKVPHLFNSLNFVCGMLCWTEILNCDMVKFFFFLMSYGWSYLNFRSPSHSKIM